MPSSRFQLTECRSCSDCVMVGLNRICAITQLCTDQLLNADRFTMMVELCKDCVIIQANYSMCSGLVLNWVVVGYTVSSM